ncbi:MAG: hypothetical protein H7Y28_02570 [Rhodoferax sp.]|nr:hypothetical protein [Rhodoferax sp.]
MKNLLIGSVMLLLGALHGLTARADEVTTVAVDPRVASTIESLEGAPNGKKTVSWASTTVLPANVGGTMDTQVAHHYLGQYKWGGQMRSVINGKGSQVMILSLCGLVHLASGTTNKLTVETPVTVPLGSWFFSWGVKSDVTLDNGVRVKRLVLTADAGNICNPVANARFSYEVTTEIFFNHKSMFYSSNKAKETVVTWFCEVGELTPSGELPFGAAYLPVQCKRTVPETHQEVTARYAFLPELGFYMEMGNGERTFAQKYRDFRFDLNPQ